MTTEALLSQSVALWNLRRDAEARGMKFHVNPPDDVIPAFLGSFRPDAIAVGPEGCIVIWAKRQFHPSLKRPLSAIAKTISEQKGWEFRGILLDEPLDDTPAIAKPTPEQLRAVVDEIDSLLKSGHPTPAFVMGWVALESRARLARDYRAAGRPGGLSPIQAIGTLGEEGYLEDTVTDRLLAMARLRNAVVHGDLSARVQEEDVAYLLCQLRAIALDVLSVMAAT